MSGAERDLFDRRVESLLRADEVGVTAPVGDRQLDATRAAAAATTRRSYAAIYFASLLLPKSTRDDFFVVAAWLREVDVLSEAAEPVKRALWRRLRRDSLAETPPDDPILLAFAEVRVRRRIPRAWVEAELDGLSNDHVAPEHRSYEDFLGYCFGALAPAGPADRSCDGPRHAVFPMPRQYPVS